MSSLRVGVIGTGNRHRVRDESGYAMAYEHGNAYRQLPTCEIVACADLVEQNARAFAAEFGGTVYTDYRKMLAQERLHVVSICTWIHLHEEMTLAAIDAGVVAVHCEKPMADTWGGARRMAAAAAGKGVQLTFNHQRRYGEPFVLAKQLLDQHYLGGLQRIEVASGNLLDSGTHFLDMCSFFNQECPVDWVLGQIDYRHEHRTFGAHSENQALVMFQYTNGVYGMVANNPLGDGPFESLMRLIGEGGEIEIGRAPQVPLRYKQHGDDLFTVPNLGDVSLHGPGFIERAIADVVDCLLTGRACQLSAANALIATEIIFAAWESSRRRGRVDCPFNGNDNALAAMVAGRALTPAPAPPQWSP